MDDFDELSAAGDSTLGAAFSVDLRQALRASLSAGHLVGEVSASAATKRLALPPLPSSFLESFDHHLTNFLRRTETEAHYNLKRYYSSGNSSAGNGHLMRFYNTAADSRKGGNSLLRRARTISNDLSSKRRSPSQSPHLTTRRPGDISGFGAALARKTR